MPQRSLRDLLTDIQQYSKIAGGLLEDLPAHAPDRSDRRLLALERCLQIVAEAFVQSLQLDADLNWRATDSTRIVAFRHLLTHHYYKVSPQMLLQIARDYLPTLRRQTAAVLNSLTIGETDALGS